MTGTPSAYRGATPLQWDSDRGTRGSTGSERSPRCTVKGCPIRYPSGPDRPCAEHRADDEVRPDEYTGPAPHGLAGSGWLNLTDQERADLRADREHGPWHD